MGSTLHRHYGAQKTDLPPPCLRCFDRKLTKIICIAVKKPLKMCEFCPES